MATVISRGWTGAKGAAKYMAAIMAGDIATAADAQSRVQIGCAGCPALVIERGKRTGVVLAWCGPALVERLAADVPKGERTCGCLVGHVERGDRHAVAEAPAGHGRLVALTLLKPAGKTTVAGETCPRGRWGAVARDAKCSGSCGCDGAATVGDGTSDRGSCAGAAKGV